MWVWNVNNEYRNAIRDLINKNIQQGTLNNLIVWDVRSDEAQDPTLLSLRIYGSRKHTDVIQVACGVSGIYEKLPEKRIAVPKITDIMRLRTEYQV